MLRRLYCAILCMALAISASAQLNTDQMLRVGQSALYFEDYVLSMQYFNQVIQVKPYLAKPYMLRAIAKVNLEDYAGTIDDATIAISLNPFLPEAWEVRGVAYHNLGNDSAAIADYDHVLELLPKNRQVLYNKGLAHTSIEQFDMAEQVFDELLREYPGFSNGYLGRARLRLAQDSIDLAAADIDAAIAINPNSVNALLMRASIAAEHREDYAAALPDMDRAVKLEPLESQLYVTRAFLRYQLDDYKGAMADLDYALQLSPLSLAALYNRSQLLMEVQAFDRALADLSQILQLKPDDIMSRYNRAIVYGKKGMYDQAIADINQVIDAEPDLSSAMFMRSEFYMQKGNVAKAEADYNRARQIARTDPHVADPDAPKSRTDAIEEAARRFDAMLTVDSDPDLGEEYYSQGIRGRVQDSNYPMLLRPIMEFSFYRSFDELHENSYFARMIDDINSTRSLRFVLMAVIEPPSLSDPAQISKHFESIDYYNSYIATHAPRAIDYLGRAMDYITLRDYASAMADLDRAIALAPDQPILYLMRAQARYRLSPDADAAAVDRHTRLTLVLADIDRAIEIEPLLAPAFYNRGIVLADMADNDGAIAAFSKAIEADPAMGEAYYNRGFILLKEGRQQEGVADLSNAGQLGVVAAYNLIKRVSR